MNIQEILESGQLELYVLGQLSEAESKEVNQWRVDYPEIEEAIRTLETSFERFAQEQALEAPPSVLEGLEQELFAAKPQGQEEEQKAKTEEEKPKPLAKRVSFTRRAFWGYLSLSFFGWAFALFFLWQYKQLMDIHYELDERYTFLAKQTERESEYCQEVSQLLRDSSTLKFILAGVETQPDAAAVVFWNHNTGLIHISADMLPSTETGKQYQLWAIVDDRPLDLGVIANEKSWLRMRTLEWQPQAFAITLEPTGGRPEPSLEQMVVFGKGV